MPITDAQRERRFDNLGASDIARALTGHVHEVCAAKIYRVPSKPNEAMEVGSMIESGLLDWASKSLGPLLRNQERRIPDTPILLHVDAVREGSKPHEPVEAKTAGIVRGFDDGTWGEPGTDEVPRYTLIQGTLHMVATEADVCHVPALIAGRGRQMFHLEHDEALAASVIEFAKRIWHDYIIPKRVPELGDDFAAADTLQLLSHIHREPNSLTAIDMKLVDSYQMASICRLWLEKAEKMAQARVIEALGNAEGADLPDGRQVRFLPVHRRAHAVRESNKPQLKILKPKPQLEKST